MLGMSATRNPYYQLPGGADLPGDVRVSDTADATKTAAGGWAASPAAVASVPENYKLLKNIGPISDFNISDRSAGMFLYFEYDQNALNSPDSSASGMCIMYTNNDSSDYGGQYAFANGGIIGRTLSSGQWSSWRTIF